MDKIDSAQWRELFRLLDLALEVPGDSRDAWIDSPAVPDGLRTALRELLSRHAARTAGFLERLPQYTRADVPGRAMPGLSSGENLGPYRLVRELGTGGMGSVWLAERADGAYKRAVALKLPHLGWDRRLLERVERERDILAGLEHPKIARFYDAGVDDRGRPFMAIEYIEGASIDRHVRERKLGIDETLRLLLDVMAAVAYAHARLVVHRDIKPGNILVDARGDAHLLDFGIARLVDAPDADAITRFAGRVFTPDYAAPEQISGQATGTSVDVYSLGVVAYELLSGERPYSIGGTSLTEIERAILETDAPPMSSRTRDPHRARALRGDLDAIVAQALRKHPADRYPSVEAFARDLERHLTGVPVTARPDSWAYRARRFAGRNRGAVAAGVLVFVAVVGGAALALHQAGIARAQEKLALAQATRAEETKRFVLSLFENADVDSGGTRATTAADLLKQARERIGVELAGNPAVAVELLNSVGYSLIGLDEVDAANEVMSDAVTLAAAKLGENHPLANAARATQGEALISAGKLVEAEPVLDAAVNGARRVDDWPALVNALRWMSDLRLKQGRYPDAMALADESVAVAELHGAAAGDRLRMEAYINQAGSWRAAGKVPFVEPARKAYELARAVFPGRLQMNVLIARATYATALTEAGELEATIRELQELLPQMIGSSGTGSRTVAITLSELGKAQLASGRVEEARASYARMLASYIEGGGDPDSREAGMVRMHVGNAAAAARDDRTAEKELASAARILAGAVGEDNLATRLARSMRAVSLARLGEFDGANRELAAMANVPPPTVPEGAVITMRIAIVRNAEREYAASRGAVAPAIATLEAAPPSLSFRISLSRAYAADGEALLESGDSAAAIARLEQARSILAQLQPGGSPDTADIDRLMNEARSR